MKYHCISRCFCKKTQDRTFQSKNWLVHELFKKKSITPTFINLGLLHADHQHLCKLWHVGLAKPPLLLCHLRKYLQSFYSITVDTAITFILKIFWVSQKFLLLLLSLLSVLISNIICTAFTVPQATKTRGFSSYQKSICRKIHPKKKTE